MRCFRSSALLIAVLTTGCAFDDGDPWGRAVFEVEAAFEPAADRLDGGALVTSGDYRVSLSALTVVLRDAEVRVATGGEAGSFDPAEPPEGYSLCHNGHCHSSEGRLVDYEDIAVAEAGGDFVAIQLLEGELDVVADAKRAKLGDCSDDCRLPRGELTLAGVRMTSLRVAGTISDPVERLTEPLSFDVTVDLDVLASTTVAGELGPGNPAQVSLPIKVVIPVEMFDGIDFSTNTDFAAALATNIAEHATVEIENTKD